MMCDSSNGGWKMEKRRKLYLVPKEYQDIFSFGRFVCNFIFPVLMIGMFYLVRGSIAGMILIASVFLPIICYSAKITIQNACVKVLTYELTDYSVSNSKKNKTITLFYNSGLRYERISFVFRGGYGGAYFQQDYYVFFEKDNELCDILAEKKTAGPAAYGYFFAKGAVLIPCNEESDEWVRQRFLSSADDF